MSANANNPETRIARPVPVWALRMLIRNDEARIEHLTQWMNGLVMGDLAPLAALSKSLDEAHAALVQHSTALRSRFSPAASSLVNAAPSGGAVQPGSLANS